MARQVALHRLSGRIRLSLGSVTSFRRKRESQKAARLLRSAFDVG